MFFLSFLLVGSKRITIMFHTSSRKSMPSDKKLTKRSVARWHQLKCASVFLACVCKYVLALHAAWPHWWRQFLQFDSTCSIMILSYVQMSLEYVHLRALHGFLETMQASLLKPLSSACAWVLEDSKLAECLEVCFWNSYLFLLFQTVPSCLPWKCWRLIHIWYFWFCFDFSTCIL